MKMDFTYYGSISSDLRLVKNFIEEILNKLNNIVSNSYFDINFNEISLKNIGGNLKLGS